MRTWNISLYNAYNAMNPNLVYTQRKQLTNSWVNNGQGGVIQIDSKSRTIIKKMTILPCIPSVTYTYRF